MQNFFTSLCNRNVLILLAIAWLSLGCARTGWKLTEEAQVAAQTETACGFVQNTIGQRISWKKDLPINVVIDDSLPPEMIDSIYEAANQWNSALGEKAIQVLQKDAIKATGRNPGDYKNVITWKAKNTGLKSSEQAKTKLKIKQNQITSSDITINAKNFSYYSRTPGSQKDVHFESLLVHEFGHLLGLKHSDMPATVMNPTLKAHEERVDLSLQDKDSLKCEY